MLNAKRGRSKASTGRAYVFDTAARVDAVVESHPLLVVGIFPGAHDVLVARVVGELVQDPAAALHLDGVAVAEVRAQVGAVGAALVLPSLEVLVLEEFNLHGSKHET